MAFKLKGKEEKFFSILENHAALTYESAEMMERVFKGEISKEEAFLEIDTKEKAADELVTETVERLRKTFITPMDREDIQLLIDQLDTTLDNIKEIMDKMVMYHVGKPSDGAIRMSEIVVKCVKHINKSIGYMGSLKKDHVKVEGRVHQVLKLESEADNIYHEEMLSIYFMTECKCTYHLPCYCNLVVCKNLIQHIFSFLFHKSFRSFGYFVFISIRATLLS